MRRAGGDARSALNIVELAHETAGGAITEENVEDAARKRPIVYDKTADAHYDFTSAFIKSMRGSDPHAAVYYLAAMLEGGEDARFIARRMIVLASEDIGNADPRALLVAVAAAQAVEHVGLPEARLNLSQAAIYLARAPKSKELRGDARLIARRMIVLASEDIGNADPQALVVAVAAAQAVEHVGLPEARLNLAQAVDLPRARAEVERELQRDQRGDGATCAEHGNVQPPKALRDGSYYGRQLGHGEGYIYPHDDPRGFEVDYLPDELKGTYVLRRRPGTARADVRTHEAARARVGRSGAPPLVCLHGVTGARRAVQAARRGALGVALPRRRARPARARALRLRAAVELRDARRRPDRDGRRARHRAGRLGRPLVRRAARPRARRARTRSGSAAPCCSIRRSDCCRTSPRSSPRTSGDGRSTTRPRPTREPRATPTRRRASSCSRTRRSTATCCRDGRAAPAHVPGGDRSRSTASSRRPIRRRRRRCARRRCSSTRRPTGSCARSSSTAYADRVEVVAVPGMHMVMWDAFDEVADAVERFLEDPRAER